MILSRRRRSFSFAGVLFLFGLFGSGHARAQQPANPEQVKAYRKHVARAEEYWEAENYPAARAEYQKAYNIEPRAILLFNIASTHRRQENVEEAMSYYQKFLDLAPSDHEYRSLAKEAIEFLEDLRRKQEREAAARARETRAATTEPAAPAGREVDRGAPGETFVYAGIATAAAGVLAAGYGIFEGKRALDRESEFENLDPGHMWSEEDEKRFDEGESFERRAIIFSIIGGTAIATGAALFVVGYQKGREAEERSVRLVPYTGDSEAGLALVGRF